MSQIYDIPGLDESKTVYTKVCKLCKKVYRTNARGQRFHSPDCQKKYAKMGRRRRAEYVKVAEHEKLRVNSHTLGVKFHKLYGPKEQVCEIPDCNNADVELHHKDIDPKNNADYNRVWLCKKCHSQIHSDLDKLLKGVEVNSFEDYVERMKKLNKFYFERGLNFWK